MLYSRLQCYKILHSLCGEFRSLEDLISWKTTFKILCFVSLKDSSTKPWSLSIIKALIDNLEAQKIPKSSKKPMNQGVWFQFFNFFWPAPFARISQNPNSGPPNIALWPCEGPMNRLWFLIKILLALLWVGWENILLIRLDIYQVKQSNKCRPE